MEASSGQCGYEWESAVYRRQGGKGAGRVTQLVRNTAAAAAVITTLHTP